MGKTIPEMFSLATDCTTTLMHTNNWHNPGQYQNISKILLSSAIIAYIRKINVIASMTSSVLVGNRAFGWSVVLKRQFFKSRPR